ncbi:Ulp1 protease familyt [Ascosphaera apis ARSEF 7405]|uniref:Ulp1 protease familyt n=1 Tax=Ascosphaera apis ARSEF 7405 TaxID=392613 RepID=A0A162I506_9EURO|nr:Ulp1 protease familyt [Ascosphaera apis ARSEF 7405]
MPKLKELDDKVLEAKTHDTYKDYYDVRLTYEDLHSLKEDEWLTDNIICFWEEWLEREFLKGQRKHIVLLRPSMSYMLLKTKDTDSLRGVLPDLSGVSHIFIVINDNENANQVEGGSHWSLLLVSVSDKRTFHYDSLACANEFEAEALTKKIGRLVGKEMKCVQVRSSPQQSNQSDCGIYVCMIMEYLLKHRICTVGRDQTVSMELDGVKFKASEARQSLFETIQSSETESH